MQVASHKISVAFDTFSASVLFDLAHREHKAVSHLVRDLVTEALELREDMYFSNIADKLCAEGAKTYSHEEAWK